MNDIITIIILTAGSMFSCIMFIGSIKRIIRNRKARVEE